MEALQQERDEWVTHGGFCTVVRSVVIVGGPLSKLPLKETPDGMFRKLKMTSAGGSRSLERV